MWTLFHNLILNPLAVFNRRNKSQIFKLQNKNLNSNNSHILFSELGVGMYTPVIIKYPFWQMTAQNPNVVYACVNLRESYCPNEIARQFLGFQGDIGNILNTIIQMKRPSSIIWNLTVLKENRIEKLLLCLRYAN